VSDGDSVSETAFVLRRVAAADTRPLRQRILRPQQRAEQLVYPHDDDGGTLHVAAFVGDDLVGTATVHAEAAPDGSAANAWRLRGMATTPEMRRKGCGAALVRACLAHVAANGGDLVWCNARTSASAFYAALGFVAQGGEFELPGIGPHYVMMKRVV
jgi:GNAT superfamily N-acetyltransferase